MVGISFDETFDEKCCVIGISFDEAFDEPCCVIRILFDEAFDEKYCVIRISFDETFDVRLAIYLEAGYVTCGWEGGCLSVMYCYCWLHN